MMKFRIYLLLFILFLSACGKIHDPSSTKQKPVKNLPMHNQIVETQTYTLQIPKEWAVEKLPPYTISFIKENIEIGGVNLQNYDATSNNPLISLLPNHSEVKESKKLDGFFTETHEIKLITSEPAAANDKETTSWIHIMFVLKDKNTLYDLFINTKYFKEEDILTLAHSFNLK